MRRFQNPDWYRVKYNLSTLYANWSAVSHQPGGRDVLRDKGAVAARELLVEAEVWRRWRRRRWNRARLRLEGRLAAARDLDQLLDEAVEPSTLILLADLTRVPDHREGLRQRARDGDLDALRIALLNGRPVDPDLLVRSVEARSGGNPTVLHNLACYYVRAGEHEEALDRVRGALLATVPSLRSLMGERMLGDPTLEPIAGQIRELPVEFGIHEISGEASGREKTSHERRPWI